MILCVSSPCVLIRKSFSKKCVQIRIKNLKRTCKLINSLFIIQGYRTINKSVGLTIYQITLQHILITKHDVQETTLHHCTVDKYVREIRLQDAVKLLKPEKLFTHDEGGFYTIAPVIDRILVYWGILSYTVPKHLMCPMIKVFRPIFSDDKQIRLSYICSIPRPYLSPV